MTKVTSIRQLRLACSAEEPEDFFISLGLARSSKSIMLTEDGHFDIVNEIDDTQQVLTAGELFTHSNIGQAIANGAFYAY
jgi:hypothetical protein